MRELGGEALADTHSVATPEGGEALINAAVDEWGQVDILINNAGILRDKAFHNLTPELLEGVLDVHLKGAFYVTRPAWVKMREQSYGRVLMATSNSGVLGNFGQIELRRGQDGPGRLDPCPGRRRRQVQHQGQRHCPAGQDPNDGGTSRPAGRQAVPELVAPVAIWLVHRDIPVTGEVYSAAGGRVARFFIGLTQGYYNPELTAEDVRDNFDQVRDQSGYLVPAGPADEVAQLLEVFGS